MVHRESDDPEYARTVYAGDAEAAAVRFCELYDSDFEYDILRAGVSAVIVIASDGAISTVDVEAETVPSYMARARL